MHLLIANNSTRVAIVAAPTATIHDCKEKVAAQTAKPNGTTEWPTEVQELRLNGQVLMDELTLAECGIKDRDRIELVRFEPAGGGGNKRGQSAALEPAIAKLTACAETLDGFEARMRQKEPVHQELFTRLLEQLDGITTEDLSDEERAFIRTQRKELIRRTESSSAASANMEKGRR